jgi:hypothetical protein
VKNHYQLLGVEPRAQAEEIKRAFRREIARYHPDKVQHLGPEFQEIAATRAAELTEAYRILMDAILRRTYDEGLEAAPADAGPPPRPAAAVPSHRPIERPQESRSSPVRPAPAEEPCLGFAQQRVTGSDIVRKAAIAKLRQALDGVRGSAAPVAVTGFDVAYVMKPRTSMFRKADPQVRLLARFVLQVDGAAVEEAWPLAVKSGPFEGVTCLMLLGSGVAPSRELSAAVARQRRKARSAGPVIVPVDVRDWEALFPPEAPEVVRQVVHRLRAGA